jgi:prepilin-type N-terminal cleavage/methylation domain-containing protein
MKALKNMGFGPRKSKSGFTLIELLIVMVILAILAGVVVMAVGGVFGSAHEAAYNSVHDDVQNAVIAYATDNNGQYPMLAGNYTLTTPVCNNCRVVNFSALLTSNGGMLREIPDGCWLSAGAGLDNCNFVTGIGCATTSHYVWIIDAYGNIYSTCRGTGCSLTNTSGFIGDYWP